MKNYYVIAFLAINSMVYSQVGINTTSPRATLDIVAKTKDGSKAEGLIPPSLSGDEIMHADNAYTAQLEGVVVYANAPVSNGGSVKTANITQPGYYYFDGKVWKSMQGNSFITGSSKLINGDYTALDNDFLIESRSSNDVNITLPAATPANKGKIYSIYNSNNELNTSSAYQVIIVSSSAVIGTPTINVSKGKFVVSDGSRWIVIGY